jgi:hypothetical protein
MICFVSGLNIGCSPFHCHYEQQKNLTDSHSKTQNVPEQSFGSGELEWINRDYIKRMFQEQNEPPTNGDAFGLRIKGFVELQKQADILMEFKNQDNVNILAVRTPINLPLGVLSFAEMQKYFTLSDKLKPSIALAVIVVPVEGPAFEEGKPDPIQCLQIIDKVLRNGGVKRRVYESYDVQGGTILDSADK